MVLRTVGSSSREMCGEFKIVYSPVTSEAYGVTG